MHTIIIIITIMDDVLVGSSLVESLTSADCETVRCSLHKLIADKSAEETKDEDESSDDHIQLIKALSGVIAAHPSLLMLVCETIASLARQETFRKNVSSEKSLMPSLITSIASPDVALQIQGLRAIGNLCYEQDDCREQFLLADGPSLLVDLLRQSLCSSVDNEHSVRLKTVLCGCILNVCCDNDKLCQLMIGMDCIKLLADFCVINREHNDVLSMAMKAIGVLLESDSCPADVAGGQSLMDSLRDILSHVHTNAQLIVIENVTDLLESILADESNTYWKDLVVDTGCLMELLRFVSSDYSNKIFDIMVHVVTYDVTMTKLFMNDALWKIIKHHIKDDSISLDTKAHCVSVIANFARNESNCEHLIKEHNMLSELICLVGGASTEESVKLHYAVMSTLRNLALPASSKEPFYHDGMLDKVIDVLNNNSDPNVLMKTVGCLRLLSKHSEICEHLALVNPIVQRIVAVSDMFSFPHVKIEGGRLLASLIKNNNRKDECVSAIIHDGATKCLVYLLGNEHYIVQNEGIIALTIAASMKLDGLVDEMLKEENITDVLVKLIKDSNAELVENCMVMLQALSDQSDTFKNLVSSSLSNEIKELTNSEKGGIADKATKLLIDL